ncbi:hypothetical protein AAULR_10670, partial [Lacticaseibacillus rhamnosus MTCC 5462]
YCSWFSLAQRNTIAASASRKQQVYGHGRIVNESGCRRALLLKHLIHRPFTSCLVAAGDGKVLEKLETANVS